jgi:hypothetical protein
MFLFSGHSTTRFADELRIPDQWLELLQVKMAGAASQSAHLVGMCLAAFAFGHRSNSFRLTGNSCSKGAPWYLL